MFDKYTMFRDIFPITSIMLIKASRPYIRKRIMTKINVEQYLLINTVSVLIILLMYSFIKQIIYKKNPLNNVMSVYKKTLFSEKLILLIFSLMSIVATYSNTQIELSKIHTNTILMRLIGSIVTVYLAYRLDKGIINSEIMIGYLITFIGLMFIGNRVVRT